MIQAVQYLELDKNLKQIDKEISIWMGEDDLKYFIMSTTRVSWEENVNSFMHMFYEITNMRHLQDQNAWNKYQRAMMSNVSHELRTPLNAIISSSEISLAAILKIEANWENWEFVDSQLEKLKKWNRTSKTSSKLLLHLVNDILDLGWLENDAFWLNIEEVDI